MNFTIPLMLMITIFVMILLPVIILSRLRHGVWFWTYFLLGKTGARSVAVVNDVMSTESGFTVNRETYGWHVVEMEVRNPVTSATSRVKKKYLGPMAFWKLVKRNTELPLLSSTRDIGPFIIDFVTIRNNNGLKTHTGRKR